MIQTAVLLKVLPFFCFILANKKIKDANQQNVDKIRLLYG